MEEETTLSNHAEDRDDNNTSPDSGLDLDLKPPVQHNNKEPALLDPLWNRRLNLLKSLSQDSEYSLDTSLFDAEEFLQDMGFAGCRDPTIPDRFLPSLMQRLSRFPESEMESLHDRIIQSIGCFRRKEGKRRLFRNLSMGKDPRRNLLANPTSSYPLLRSNTDPTTFPYDETTSESSLVSSGRLSSNDSKLHSLGSSKDEGEFPESPIAILVSAASVDQDERLQQKGLADAASQVDLDDPPSDIEFESTVDEIQKLTHTLSDLEDFASESVDDGAVEVSLESFPSSEVKGVAQNLVAVHQSDEGRQPDVSFDSNQEVSIEEDCCIHEGDKRTLYHPLFENSDRDNDFELECVRIPDADECSGKISSVKDRVRESLDRVSSVMSTNVKSPLRRTSNAQFFNPKSSRTLVSTERTYTNQLSKVVEKYTESVLLVDHCSSDRKNESKNLEAIGSSFCGEDADKSSLLNNDPRHEPNASKFQLGFSAPQTKGNFNKPKFSRDDSLTNFLSSMLDTGSNSGPTLAPLMLSDSEDKCNSDSEVPGSFSSAPFTVMDITDSNKKIQSKETPTNKFVETVLPAEKCPTAKIVADKAPNRKRRVLRRMSSSLQCCDDVNCSESSGFKIDLNDNVTQPLRSSSENHQRPKKPLRGTAKPSASKHRVIHSCSSLPATNLSSCYRDAYCTRSNESLNCSNHVNSVCKDCHPVYVRNSIHFRRCKRKRNLSCPSPGMWFNPRVEVKAFHSGQQCGCVQYRYEHGLPRPFAFNCSVMQNESWNYSCCDGNSCCRLNGGCSVSHSNDFNSLRTDNYDPNMKYFSSPHLILPLNRDVFVMESNLRNQNRHFCYSSPELRHECCSTSNNHLDASYVQRDLDECEMQPSFKFDPETSYGKGNHIFDEVFLPNSRQYFESQLSQQDITENDTAKLDIAKTNKLNRIPQRQNSISIADSEIPTQSYQLRNSSFPFPPPNSYSVYSNKNSAKEKIVLSTDLSPASKNNKINFSPSMDITKSSQKRDAYFHKSSSDINTSATYPAPNNNSVNVSKSFQKTYYKKSSSDDNLFPTVVDPAPKSNVTDDSSSINAPKSLQKRCLPCIKSTSDANPLRIDTYPINKNHDSSMNIQKIFQRWDSQCNNSPSDATSLSVERYPEPKSNVNLLNGSKSIQKGDPLFDKSTTHAHPFPTDPHPTPKSNTKKDYQSLKTLQKSDPHCTKSTSDNLAPIVDDSSLKTGDSEEGTVTPSPKIKSEALLERKIRIFSKFLANLGNLTKSMPDTKSDNKHKGTRDQKSPDVITHDKKTKNRSVKVSCPGVQSRRYSNPTPELGKLLNLLKTMESECGKPPRKGSEKKDVPTDSLQKSYSPVYENKVLLQSSLGADETQRLFQPVLYTSSMSLFISEDKHKDIHTNRCENSDTSRAGQRKFEEISAGKETYHSVLSQMPFRGVSKEIEDLQHSIQKAKEMRMCASKELHLLQELLSMDSVDENHEDTKGNKMKDSSKQETNSAETGSHALTDLREKSKHEVSEDASFWKEEIKRVKEETKNEWKAKLDRMEARLLCQEEELRRLQGDNDNFNSTACHQCRTESNGQNGRTDSAFEDDEEYHKPSIPIQSTRQECDRLQQRLMEEEQRADQLNLLLNQKLIELNKVQITLSKQTKDMIELEKSYVQLQCRLRRGTSKPIVTRLCSRSSPFSPKNLCPGPSPPASPQPSTS